MVICEIRPFRGFYIYAVYFSFPNTLFFFYFPLLSIVFQYFSTVITQEVSFSRISYLCTKGVTTMITPGNDESSSRALAREMDIVRWA
jgi:hypothetical protein